jgi:predicted MPP superfamily phosphohydrolase
MLTAFFYDGIIALIVAAVPAYFAATFVRRRRHKGSGPGIPGAAFALVWLVVVYGSFIAPKLLTMRTTDIRIGASADASPKAVATGEDRTLVVALISDTDLGQYRQADWLAQVVARINSAHPDLVLIDGDIVSNPAGLQEFAPLRNLKSRFGTYATLGDSDYAVGAVDVRKRIESFDTQLLVNKSASFDADGQTVSLIGLDDMTYGHPDLDLATKDVPSGAETLLLAHEPDIASLAETRGIDLVMSGPAQGIRRFDEGPFSFFAAAAGDKRFGRTQLFITPGVGESDSRMRLLDLPQISILRITF